MTGGCSTSETTTSTSQEGLILTDKYYAEVEDAVIKNDDLASTYSSKILSSANARIEAGSYDSKDVREYIHHWN